METDLDLRLRGLAVSDHPGLDGLDGAVLARVKSRREMRVNLRITVVAAIGATLLGTYAAAPGAPPASAAPLAPFDVAAPLAPSTLLASDR